MLEMRLAESTEAMLALMRDAAGAQYHEPPGGGDRHVEAVAAGELRALPRRLAGDGDQPDLDAGLAGETIAVLADTCCSGDQQAAAHAVAMLHARWGLDAATPPEAATAVLMPLLEEAIAGNDDASAELGTICERIVATVGRHARGEPPPDPGGVS
jgi:hypothetical protein